MLLFAFMQDIPDVTPLEVGSKGLRLREVMCDKVRTLQEEVDISGAGALECVIKHNPIGILPRTYRYMVL